MAPAVLSELLSDPKLSAALENTLREVPLLETSERKAASITAFR